MMQVRHKRSGNIYNLIGVVRMAKDCTIEEILYQSTVPTDFPPGSYWRLPEDEFWEKFETIEGEEK